MTTSQPPAKSRLRPMVRPVFAFVSLAVVVALGVGAYASRTRDPAQMLERARDLSLEGRHVDALTQLHRVFAELGDEGDADLRRRALVRAAQITDLHLGERRINEAIGWYQQVMEGYPGTDDAFDAGVRIADILRQRLGDDARASEQLVRVVDAFPEHPGAARLLLRAGRIALEAKLYDQAKADARRLIASWPEAPEAVEAEALVASTFHLEGRHADAAAAWEALARRYEGTPEAARALAEAGHCLEEQMDLVHAMARYLQALPLHPDPFAVQKRLDRARRKFVAEKAMHPGSAEVAFR